MRGRGSGVKPPTDAFIRKVEAELRTLPPGSQRALGGGVYLRLDGDDQRRYTYRGSKIEPGGTCASWEEAHRRRLGVAERSLLLRGDALAEERFQLREVTFAAYASRYFWPDWAPEKEAITVADYKGHLRRDVLALFGSFTLRELDERLLLMDRLKQQLRERKRYPAGHKKRAGEVPIAACNNVLKVASTILEHAHERGIISRNPLRNVQRFRTGWTRTREQERQVRRSEVFHPSVIGAITRGMQSSDPVERLRRRLVPLLIMTGFRPEVICGMTWSEQRTSTGPRPHFALLTAVKLVNGKPQLGLPKTGECEPFQFPIIADLFERLYELAGRPKPSERVFPNGRGGLIDWNNFRDDVWYPGLHRAGIASAPSSDAEGAFYPYLLRHIGVTTMLHARRHDGEGGYNPVEVANQFSHTAETLFRAYAKVLGDVHGVAGKTMNEIISGLLRDEWGPMPGDPDYVDEWLTTVEAAELTGRSVESIGGRIRRGSLPGRKVGARYQVTRFELAWAGLIGIPARGKPATA